MSDDRPIERTPCLRCGERCDGAACECSYLCLSRRHVEGMPQRPQAQFPLLDQVLLLHTAANKLGLYDAADWISDRLSAALGNDSTSREDSDAAPTSWTRLGLTQAQWEDSDHE